MNARFHAPDANHEGEVVLLPDEEARHLTQVLRLKSGALIRVFNGRGQEFDAVVARAGQRQVEIRVGSSRDAAPEARVAITLAQAVLKGDKMDTLVRDAVMIGAAAIQPVVTARSEVTLQSLARGHRHARWERIAISSAKQCGRAVVPAIHAPLMFEAVVAALAGMILPRPALMCMEPSAAPAPASLADIDATPPRETTLLIGPEGGWAPEELHKGATVALPVTFGGRTLRADAMPLVAITALLTRWREL